MFALIKLFCELICELLRVANTSAIHMMERLPAEFQTWHFSSADWSFPSYRVCHLVNTLESVIRQVHQGLNLDLRWTWVERAIDHQWTGECKEWERKEKRNEKTGNVREEKVKRKTGRNGKKGSRDLDPAFHGWIRLYLQYSFFLDPVQKYGRTYADSHCFSLGETVF